MQVNVSVGNTIENNDCEYMNIFTHAKSHTHFFKFPYYKLILSILIDYQHGTLNPCDSRYTETDRVSRNSCIKKVIKIEKLV